MNFFKNRKIWLILAVILVSVIIYMVRIQNTNSTTTFNPKNDKVVSPVVKDLKNNLILTGSIDASSKTNLQFQTSGRLVWVGVKIGDRVKKWQAIASLDKTLLKKSLLKDFNNYKSSLDTFNDTQDKYKKTVENYLLTDEIRRILDRSQNTLGNSVVDYEITDLAIKYVTIVSPIDGIVVNLDQPLAGVNINPATANYFIVDPKSIFFKSQIDQSDLPSIKTDQAVTVKLDSYPDQTINSKINYIAFAPVAGQTSTVYEIRFDLPLNNQDLNYRLGMDGDATITLSESKNAITIPTDALLSDNGQVYVLVKDNKNKLTKKYLKIGIETDTDTEVLQGISQNDQIVIKKQ